MYYLIHFRFKDGSILIEDVEPSHLQGSLHDYVTHWLKDKPPIKNITVEIKNPTPDILKKM